MSIQQVQQLQYSQCNFNTLQTKELRSRNILWLNPSFIFSIFNKHLNECQNRNEQFSKLKRNTRERYRDLPILVQWRQLHFSMRLRTCARTHDDDSASRNLQYYFTWDACSVIYAVRYTIPYNWQDDRWIRCRDLIEITASIRSFFSSFVLLLVLLLLLPVSAPSLFEEAFRKATTVILC